MVNTRFAEEPFDSNAAEINYFLKRNSERAKVFLHWTCHVKTGFKVSCRDIEFAPNRFRHLHLGDPNRILYIRVSWINWASNAWEMSPCQY
jgi:hypothetical protein